MIKKILIGIAVIIIGFGLFYFLNKKNEPSVEQQVYSETITISKKYVSLRYQTDNLLVNAKNYPDYESWNKEMISVIKAWENLEKESVDLEKSATEMSENKITLKLISPVFAYNKQEISDVFDKAPAGKKIATLAKHLGVDAKMAFKILQQDQAQIEADAWNEAGDTFQKLETSAIVIKDGCKVAGFIGGIAVTGGTSALAAGSTLTKMAVIVSGADLTLEVASDGANIGLGNNNKISTVINSARVVTEPLASILTITNIPGNLSTGFEKFGAVMVGLEQFNSAAQEGKVVGIQLPAYTKDKSKPPVKVAVLEKEEIEKWIEDQGINNKSETVEEVKKILEIINNPEETKKVLEKEEIENKTEAVGIWEGVAISKSSSSEPEKSDSISFELKKDGNIESIKGNWDDYNWVQEGDSVKISGEYGFEKGYHEFKLSGDTLTFIKIAGEDQEDSTKWVEVYAGEDFFGGKMTKISLKKQ